MHHFGPFLVRTYDALRFLFHYDLCKGNCGYCNVADYHIAIEIIGDDDMFVNTVCTSVFYIQCSGFQHVYWFALHVYKYV